MGTHKNKSTGMKPASLPRAQIMDEIGHDRAPGKNLLAVDDDDALRHQAGAERHDQWLNAQNRNAETVDQANHQATGANA
jgi:hypothetical protein